MGQPYLPGWQRSGEHAGPSEGVATAPTYRPYSSSVPSVHARTVGVGRWNPLWIDFRCALARDLQVLAGLRNLVISLVRRAGHSNVAAALRRHNAHLSEAFDMMGFTYQAGE